MFALWYFSLALDEVRRRFGFIDRIITFFTGKPLTYQPPALESPTPNETEPTESNVSPIPDPIPYADQPASPKVSPASPPKPAEKPTLKPAPAPPAAKPAGPPKTAAPEPQPKVDLPPTPEPKPEPKKQPKPVPTPKVEPTPAPKPSKPLEPVSNGHSKAPEPAKVAAAPAELVKLTDDSANSHPSAAASIAVELPGSNEDSFIIVEKQKPKPADNIPTTPTATINKAAVNVKNSTLDFLKAEGGGRGASAVAGPATPRNKSDTMVDAAVMEKMEAGFAKLAASDSKSLLKKYLTKEVFDALKNKKTSFGSTLLDCVQSGFENPDSGVGIYAPDAEAYSLFSDLFDPIIEDYHKGFKKTDKHPARDFGDVDTFGNVDPTGEFVVSTRVRCGRSMEGYPFNPCLTEAQYKEMEDKVSSTLSGLEGELKGKFYPLTGMDKAVQQQLIDDHFLFKEGDRFLQAANACRFWPTGRGIYHNDNKTFLVWCNEEDHLRIISMQMGGDLGQVYRRLVTAVNDIEKRIPFSHHDRLGFLTFCPTNLGTTIRASVHIKVPKLAKDYAKLESIADKYNLQVRGTRGEHSEAEGGIYDISNKRRMGLTEYQAVKEMYDGISELIKIEKSL
ncbi:arginine kinase 1 isoform X1 [Aedes albopictus]|uniref:arginine kinase n=3 Tax=Aedes albopictus TaxID=7160 RepID=A0ABM1ZV73_AEDAL